MTFYIIANQITTLFLSLQLLTTLSFDSEITSYIYGGSKEEIYFKVTNKSKTLAIKPILIPSKNGRYSNLLVVTKKAKYYFNLGVDESSPHQFVEIKDARGNSSMKEVLSTKDYKILSGDKSNMIINLTDKKLRVNEMDIARKSYVSKGVPIIIDGKRILN